MKDEPGDGWLILHPSSLILRLRGFVHLWRTPTAVRVYPARGHVPDRTGERPGSLNVNGLTRPGGRPRLPVNENGPGYLRSPSRPMICW